MGREDWYRNTHWDSETEAGFRAKLARSRSSRPQYLRIQAHYLAERYPEAALQLIEEYFDTGDEFDVPNALCTRAEANLALGKKAEAVAAYKQALQWEATHSRHISTARIDFPKLVATDRLSSEYEYALDILTSRFSPLDYQFPNTRYLWNGSCALIAQEQGQQNEAKEFAERAVSAATETESPFRYHRTVGVVRDTSDDFGRRIKRIVQPSRVRSLLRLFSVK
jgi:tetratricopeptide (TPR) repeat protein